MVAARKALSFRAYQPGDEQHILSLFRETFHREVSYAFWKWRYIDNPFGRAISRLAFDGDEIVGHLAVLPMEVQFEGRILRSIFPVTAMTHPDYAGRGIFTRLITDIYDGARNSGFDIAHGFFNINTYHANVHHVGYRESDIIKMNTLEKRIDTKAHIIAVDKSVKQVVSFDSNADVLWSKVKDNFKAIVPRTSRFLNWRFAEYKEIDYPKFVFFQGNDILGYIVLKIYVEGSTVRGHIVDLLTIPDEKVVKSLVERAYAYFTEKKVPDISLWMMEHSLYSRIFEKEGFARREGVTNFAVLLLDRRRTELLPIEKPANWHLTMGDSDVF